MSQHKFWIGIDPLNISSPDQVPDKIVKLCSIGSNFLILTESHIIYQCSIIDGDLSLKRIQNLFAIDISCYKDVVYIIDVHGRLYKANTDLENKEEIVIREEAKSCPHGFRTPSFKVRFRNVVTNNFGELFVSSDGQLWGSGSMSQVGLDSNSIKKVHFFEGRTIYSASIGDNFAAVIARKKVRKLNCDSDSENDDEEVFASNCAQCQSIIGLASPASVPSLSDTCPLGVQISKSSEDSSSTTAPQTDVHVDAHSLTEDSSPSSEESKIATTVLSIETDNPDANTKIITNVEEVKLVTEDVDKDLLNEINDKTNNIFINTDAARQFLSRQLSWVSAGEDYIVEYTEKPTRIIKENVSNLTNFVYEGVKTVGDKVATLSRHVSGSSETNEVVELFQHHNHNINSLMYNCAPTCNNDDLQISTSTVSSEKEFERARQNENIKIFSKFGKNILATELWTWGDVTYGQLGIGDTIKRVKPVVVMNLSGFGLQKVSCGKWHCSVLTLDGRVFCWGYNNYHQVSLDSQENKSGPKQFTQNSSSDRIRDVVSTDNHTLAYTHNENIYYMGKHCDGYTNSILNLNKNNKESIIKNENEDKPLNEPSPTLNIKNKNERSCYHWRVLSSGNISYCAIEESTICPEFQDLSIAQRYLEEMILISQSIVKPFVKKSKTIMSNCEIYESVCALFNDILNITALNVLSMWQFAEKHINECDISLIKNLDEYIYLYTKYSISICNLIVIGGFSQINNVIDVPSNIYNLFSDQLPSNKKKNNKKTSESLLSLAFMQALTRLSSYKCIVQSLLRYKNKNKNNECKSNADDKLNKVISSLDMLIDEQDKKRKEAEGTKSFWETIVKPLEQFRTPERRLIRESKTKPLNFVNPSRFTTHWFILFNDLFVHMVGNTPYAYPLQTLWIEGVSNTDTLQNAFQLITPEDTINVYTNTEQEKTEWIQVLNSYIKMVLNKESAFKPPSVRTAKYTFSSKHPFYKEAQYTGRWLDGKAHGNGKVEWQDGKLYIGQFQMNALCGHGKMDIPSLGTYEGQWKDNFQNGFGILKYTSGDIYEGYFKDGLPHGHGIKKQGDFTSSNATIYTGEWQNGVKHGYGVMDDIGKGEKYLGNWSDNKKNGCGLIVTLDGIYYEGLFMQDVLTGHGVMVFEDGTHYEGEFKSAGVFSGKGTLTLSSGDKIEGSLSGAWTDGVKVNGTMHLNVSDPAPPANSKPNSFGKLCVAPNQKWNALFRQCYKNLGINETLLTPTGNHYTNANNGIENKKIWQNVAVAISKSFKGKKTKKSSGETELEKSDCLEVIPQFGQKTLNIESYMELKSYLQNACETSHHPLGQLVLGLTNAFNTTYGGVRVHPLLLSHAVKELKSITSRLYHIVRLLFPALPPEGTEVVLPYKTVDSSEINAGTEENNPLEGEVVSSWSLLQASLLPRAHPALFVLYALHNQREDAAYWRRLLKWNRHPDLTLMAFLGIDQKFWIGYNSKSDLRSPTYSPMKDQMFQEAVETLQQLKTTFSPMEKLLVIRSTFQKMTSAVQQELGSGYLWSMDELFPVFHFVVVRARVLQLGSELHFLEDFLEPGLQHGELGLMFTTLKACYFQILQEKMSFNS